MDFDLGVFLPRGAKRSRSQLEEDNAVQPASTPQPTADSNGYSAASNYRQGRGAPTNVPRYPYPFSISLPRSLPPQNRPPRGQPPNMGPHRPQQSSRQVTNTTNGNSYSHSTLSTSSSSSSFSPLASSSSSSGSSTSLDDSDVFVIDLTADDNLPPLPPPPPMASANLGDASRGPRFAREIIDISSDISSHPQGDGSPDVQFLRSQELPASRSSTRPPPAATASDPIDLEADVQFIRSNVIAPPPHHRSPSVRLPMIDASVSPFVNVMSGTIRRVLNSHGFAAAFASSEPGVRFESPASGFHAFFRAPELDYSNVGFNLGADTPDREDTASPASPPYLAPSRPPPGFIRTPDEDDILICPNCDDELCVGEDDVKKQAWAVRACGHVYCGECTQGRSVTARRKAKAPIRTKPFKECVVDGCGQKTTGKWNMIQLFL